MRLRGAWIKKIEVVVGARIRSEKLREHLGYARSLEGKGVGWDGDNNFEHMWEEVKRAMVESAREVCDSIRVGGKNPKSVWWNYEIKAVVRKKETAWKEMLAASDEEVKEGVWKRTEKRRKRIKNKSQMKVNEQFESKIIEDMNGNRKLFWKEVSNTKGGKVECCSRIKDGNGKLAQGEDEVLKIWN